MARSRNIKPGFYKNEDLAECSVWARFIFPGLWMLADREGRLEDRPKRIKAELLPFDNCEVDELLIELERRGFIHRYRNETGNFIQILKFKDHQSPHYTEKDSCIKPPELPEYSKSAPDISESEPVIKEGSKPPDLLIPDSLIPETLEKALSGTPDVVPTKQKFQDQAKEVLEFMNRKSGRSFRFKPTNLNLIAARLKDGATVQDCKTIIVKKINEWTGDPKSETWIRPSTIFRACNFEQYLGQLVEPAE